VFSALDFEAGATAVWRRTPAGCVDTGYRLISVTD
jgi:hypothetical protein